MKPDSRLEVAQDVVEWVTGPRALARYLVAMAGGLAAAAAVNWLVPLTFSPVALLLTFLITWVFAVPRLLAWVTARRTNPTGPRPQDYIVVEHEGRWQVGRLGGHAEFHPTSLPPRLSRAEALADADEARKGTSAGVWWVDGEAFREHYGEHGVRSDRRES
jgi:hypothetical protein